MNDIERLLITVELPSDQETWRPDPFPGSDEAFDKGCTCPQAQPWPGHLILASDCPIHEMEGLKQ